MLAEISVAFLGHPAIVPQLLHEEKIMSQEKEEEEGGKEDGKDNIKIQASGRKLFTM